MTDSAERLEPCPFCGAAPILVEHPAHKHSIVHWPDHPGSWTIECPACECGMISETKDRILAAWNRRAPAAGAPADMLDEVWGAELLGLGGELSAQNKDRVACVLAGARAIRKISGTGDEGRVQCRARGSIGANDPQDCDWPTCGCDLHANKVIEALQEIGAIAEAGAPSGWKLVPVEPTDEMQAAAAQAIRFDTTLINKLWTGNAVLRAGIAAAPAAPKEK